MAIDTPARIAILGAGPIGLEAALYARYLGYDVDIYERGRVAEHVLRWGHARMFSPFCENRSPLGMAALKAQDPVWEAPRDESLLTGRDFATRYLIPLSQSDLLVDGLHEQTEVISIGRDGVGSGDFEVEPTDEAAHDESEFRILLRSTNPEDRGREHLAAANVIIDTTGVYGQHNWLGHGGMPAIGEIAAQSHIEYGLPDVLGAERARYASRNTLLIGSGYFAAANLVALADLASQSRDTWITWVVASDVAHHDPQPIAQAKGDPFVERDRLVQAANRLATSDANHVTFLSGTSVESLAWHADLERFSVRLLGKHAGELEFDRILADVGFRPDHGIYRELQVEQSPATAGPAGWAAELARWDTSQGAADRAFAAEALVTSEPDFYILGRKSFGRDPRFLISTGLDQIRALFTILGDRRDLDLYATMAGLY